jgi:dienelactone hydrolase
MRRWLAVAAAGLLIASGCGSPAADHVRITVAAPDALFDAPLGITVTGAPPGKLITLTASATDSHGDLWRSSATFRPDSSGRIDPARTAPVAGDYTGAHDAGLLWSMTDPGAHTLIAPVLTVHLAASLDGRSVATASLTRAWAPPSLTERETSVAQEGFAGTLFSPPDTTVRRPAVLAFGGSEGGTGNGVLVAKALAAKGYTALGIGYFHVPGQPDTLKNIPLEYFATAVRWLARQPGVDPHRIEVYGFSRGTEAALLLAVDFPDLVDGVVAGSPSSVVHASYPRADGPAWTLHGRPIPYVDRTEVNNPRPAGDRARIPVQRIRGPVFLLCGQADAVMASCPFTQAIGERLRARPYAELQVSDAGHLVGIPVAGGVNTPEGDLGGTQQADALGRLDAWPKLLAFLAARTESVR